MTSFPEGESGGAMPHGAMPLGMNSFLIMVLVSLLKTPIATQCSLYSQLLSFSWLKPFDSHAGDRCSQQHCGNKTSAILLDMSQGSPFCES
jgi:hypothetical protein